MASQTINILISSFTGLGLPSTLVIPICTTTSITDLRTQILDRLPPIQSRYIITTHSNKKISSSSSGCITSLLSKENVAFLPLRLSVPLCGGKGGFGSQLRAAGGRMSSRRKNNQGESNSSNRNLDGRRLRTVAEAKALAEYLALKPDMEKKEKDARRRRWEQVIELAGKRQDDIRIGCKGRVDGKWVEDKGEAEERTREAVLEAMRFGDYHDNLQKSTSGVLSDGSTDASEGDDDNEGDDCKGVAESDVSDPGATTAHIYHGFDEDDEFSSEEVDGEPEQPGDLAIEENL